MSMGSKMRLRGTPITQSKVGIVVLVVRLMLLDKPFPSSA